MNYLYVILCFKGPSDNNKFILMEWREWEMDVNLCQNVVIMPANLAAPSNAQAGCAGLGWAGTDSPLHRELILIWDHSCNLKIRIWIIHLLLRVGCEISPRMCYAHAHYKAVRVSVAVEFNMQNVYFMEHSMIISLHPAKTFASQMFDDGH